MPLQKDLKKIRIAAADKEAENDLFRIFLKQYQVMQIDRMVHELNEEISLQVDCTSCGNCCKSLLHVTSEEIVPLAAHLKLSPCDFKLKYLEEGSGGQMVINKIPCHFLSGTTCSVYEYRFTVCREFPHLHKPNFTGRLFGTLMYYGVCPIIFNVVEKLKEKLGFNNSLYN